MPDKQKEIDVKIAEVQKKASEGSLFGAEPVMPEPQPAQVIQPVAPQPVPGHAPDIREGNRYGCSHPNNRPANLPTRFRGRYKARDHNRFHTDRRLHDQERMVHRPAVSSP